MKQAGRWLLTVFGYLLYTAGVFVVLLWILFPADSALAWLQGKLRHAYPSLSWDFSGVEKNFPLKLRLSAIRVYEKSDRENPLFQIDEVYVSPMMEKLTGLKKQVPVRFLLEIFDGTVSGELLVPGNGETVQCSGEMQGIQLGKFEEIWKKTNRSGSGKMTGTFQYAGTWHDPLQGSLQASVQVSDGAISLQQPIFGMEQVAFESTATDLALSNRTVTLDNGVMDSHLFTATYKGNMTLADNLYTSGITLQGFMEPRPELLGGLQNPTAASLIKSQLQDDRLSFTISGTLLEPGILFKGASGIIDGVIEGGGR